MESAMTAVELIQALQAMPPTKTVKVVLYSVFASDEVGDYELELNDHDAQVSDTVMDMGSHILIRSR
jgi:hypothetical protein